MSLILTGVAWADDISNDLDASIDAAPESISLTTEGSATVGLYVQPRNDDGKNGCNLTQSSTLVVSVNSTDATVATVSPTSITFESCGDTPAITVTPVGPGTATVHLIQTSNTTGASFNLNPAAFTVNVAAPPPSDTTPPAISYVLNPAEPDGANGWYVSDVELTWTVVENESPSSLEKTGCVDQNITADQAATYSCSATSDGGSAGPVEVTIQRDATPPTISGSASPAANSHGWNNTNVTVSFTCGDNLSGVAPSSCGPNQVLTGEGSGQSATGTATDEAGNTASATVSGIDIDKTAPSVALIGGPADGESYYFGSVPAAPTCSASDALSGLDGACVVSGYGTTVGQHTVTASATDRAGNANSDAATYTVLAWALNGFNQPVDMDKVNTVKGGSTVPLKFEVFAGSTELTDVSVVDAFIVKMVSCTTFNGEPIDDIELTTTGGTVLRYDWTAGQFIQNWQTPKGAGLCYTVMMTTDDGSYIGPAYFKTK